MVSAHASGSLSAGYRLSFLIATGVVALAVTIVLVQLNLQACQRELARQREAAGDDAAPVSKAGASLCRA